jgi:hypothetical protein
MRGEDGSQSLRQKVLLGGVFLRGVWLRIVVAVEELLGQVKPAVYESFFLLFGLLGDASQPVFRAAAIAIKLFFEPELSHKAMKGMRIYPRFTGCYTYLGGLCHQRRLNSPS